MSSLLMLAALTLHDEKVSASTITVEGDTVTWTVQVGTPALQKVLRLPADPVDLTEEQLASIKADISGYLASCIHLRADGRDLRESVGELTPVYEPFRDFGVMHIAQVRQEFVFKAPGNVAEIEAAFSFFERLAPDHRAVVNVSWEGEEGTFTRDGPSEIILTRALVRPTFLSTAGQFLVWGMKHILVGFDHIAFLLGLIVASRRFVEVVKIVTAFTLAHSITLTLAALEVLAIPSALAEAAIAASIVYVAVENFFLKDGRWRWIVAFAFGLIHGVGFAGFLARLLPEEGILAPVLSFNVGVELGQLAIVAVVFPLLLAACRHPEEKVREVRHRRILTAGSIPVLLFGAGWLIERVLGLEFMPL